MSTLHRRAWSNLVPLALTPLLLAGAACGFGSKAPREDPAVVLGAVKQAHASYVAAINSNKPEQWLASLDDEVVLLVPNQKPIAGKPAVGEWTSRYLREVTTRWSKALDDVQVTGDWAFGRYSYTASDSVIIRDPETDGGGTANDTGWGLIVYHKGPDGVWRVAREAWGSDRPAR
jgi:ketosteroid isomerase-like protein